MESALSLAIDPGTIVAKVAMFDARGRRVVAVSSFPLRRRGEQVQAAW
jgi:sugar (pentulose or hexulose) kinase